MININFRDSRPIYEQVKTTLRKLIVSGAMSPDEKLPSVRELASQLVINPNTIQRAYRELEAGGLHHLHPRQGQLREPPRPGGRGPEEGAAYGSLDEIVD